MQDLPLAERPRERLAELGSRSLTSAELLAILLRTGVKGCSAVQLGHRLYARFESLEALAKAPLEELQSVPGIKRDKAVTVKAAFELAVRLTEEVRKESPTLDTPDRIADLLRDRVLPYETERMFAVLLNTRRRLIRIEEVGHGLLDAVLTHPREVFRKAIVANAHGLVLVHNHPGGDPSPSEADIRVTRDLLRAARLLRIELVDHVILGRKSAERPRDYCSLRELGYFHE